MLSNKSYLAKQYTVEFNNLSYFANLALCHSNAILKKERKWLTLKKLYRRCFQRVGVLWSNSVDFFVCLIYRSVISYDWEQGIGNFCKMRNAFRSRSFANFEERVPFPFLFFVQCERSFSVPSPFLYRSFTVPFQTCRAPW